MFYHFVVVEFVQLLYIAGCAAVSDNDATAHCSCLCLLSLFSSSLLSMKEIQEGWGKRSLQGEQNTGYTVSRST